MNIFLIKLFGFLVGLFITLFIIDYYDIRRKNIETFETKPIIPTEKQITPKENPVNQNNDSLIPYKSFKYMCINTFFDITKIDNNFNRWYECDLDKNLIKTLKTNENHYFTYDKIINVKQNTINNTGSYGADINGVELKGPKSFYFANNIDTNELTEFTILMSIKIKDITAKNNIIFELAGNTESINNDKPKYLISMVNINISINKNNNYDFIITIGDSIYSGNIDNIEKATLKNNDFIVIGLIYTNTEISFMINKQIYKYKTKDTFKVKLGSTPLIINKQGLMNIHLYSFVFYKTPLPSNEYLLFLKHNYYYLSGLNNIIKNTTKPPPPPPEIKARNELDNKLQDLENKINEKINKQIEDNSINKTTTIELKKIQPLDIQPIKDTEVKGVLTAIF
jgi:hypothetical protein